jgi:hypothetical protein
VKTCLMGVTKGWTNHARMVPVGGILGGDYMVWEGDPEFRRLGAQAVPMRAEHRGLLSCGGSLSL